MRGQTIISQKDYADLTFGTLLCICLTDKATRAILGKLLHKLEYFRALSAYLVILIVRYIKIKRCMYARSTVFALQHAHTRALHQTSVSALTACIFILPPQDYY